MSDQEEKEEEAREKGMMLPRIFLNAFPKSGTHLGRLLIVALAQPQHRADGLKNGHWFSSFSRNTWSDEWLPPFISAGVIMGQQAGTWMQGHCGHTLEMEKAFDKMGTCIIFVYRDLRDVAVSLSHHVEDSSRHFCHSERELYMAMDTHEDRIIGTIEGVGYDPGLIERWKLYAPWLDVPWVLALKFEDIVADPRAAAEKVLQYVIKRTAEHHGYQPVVYYKQYEILVNKALEYIDKPKEYSPTYRKGIPGEWRHEFTPEVTRVFIEYGGLEWLERLGYDGFDDRTKDGFSGEATDQRIKDAVGYG